MAVPPVSVSDRDMDAEGVASVADTVRDPDSDKLTDLDMDSEAVREALRLVDTDSVSDSVLVGAVGDSVTVPPDSEADRDNVLDRLSVPDWVIESVSDCDSVGWVKL